MSFFEHLGGDRPDRAAPSRVYARVDGPSTRSADGYTRLDCLDAHWADEVGLGRGALCDPELTEEVEQRVSMMLVRTHTTQEDEGQLLELTLEEARAGEGTALHYINLTGPPIPQDVTAMNSLSHGGARRIADITDIDGLRPASPDDLERAVIRASDAVDAVAVYDVGQGSCSALLKDGAPTLYFDVGGGALNNAATFPQGFDALCVTQSPTVVLSHWHYDHWSLAKRFDGQLLQSRWIVPRQGRPGFTASVLLGLIRKHGEALLWPETLAQTRWGAVAIHRCNGRSRNDSGIALIVHGPNNMQVVLPGDARYRYITALPRVTTSLVAAHHGGVTGAQESEIPRPDGERAGRLVYSCGDRNSYGHPMTASVVRHNHAWGQSSQLRTSDREQGRDHQHVHLYWDHNQPVSQLGCGGKMCSLEPCRR